MICNLQTEGRWSLWSQEQERGVESPTYPCQDQVWINYIVNHKFVINRKAARQLLTLDEKDTKRVFEGIYNI